jgi:hypothetical protein
MHKGHIVDLLKQPSAETYGVLMRCVIEHPDFRIRSDVLRELWKRFEAGDLAAVREGINTIAPLWIHSPDYHILRHALAKRDGDAQSADIEARFAYCCFQGMLATGDGSYERPYQVARVEDEYVLLRHLSIAWTRQSMLERDQRVIDIFERSDGTPLHFQLPKADLLTGKAL